MLMLVNVNAESECLLSGAIEDRAVTGNRVVAFVLLRIVFKGLCGISHIIPILLPAKILAEIDGLRIAMPFPWPTTR